jgi:hypothetical protein
MARPCRSNRFLNYRALSMPKGIVTIVNGIGQFLSCHCRSCAEEFLAPLCQRTNSLFSPSESDTTYKSFSRDTVFGIRKHYGSTRHVRLDAVILSVEELKEQNIYRVVYGSCTARSFPLVWWRINPNITHPLDPQGVYFMAGGRYEVGLGIRAWWDFLVWT